MGFSVYEAVFGSPLSVPGEFLDSLELSSSSYRRKIEKVIAGFAVTTPHHVYQSPSRQLPPAFWTPKFFVCLRGCYGSVPGFIVSLTLSCS